MSQKWALVSGGSIGIGYEICKLFAYDGVNLVIPALPTDDLDRAANFFRSHYGVEVVMIPADLILDTEPKRIFDLLAEKGIKIDFLVNNAGFGMYGDFLKTQLDREAGMVKLNCISLMSMTALFLEQAVREGRHLKIMNLASTAAFQPGPYMAVYYATKAFVYSFSLGLRLEMEDLGYDVTVTALCPGPTISPVASPTGSHFWDNLDTKGSWLFTLMKPTTPEQVAKAGYKAMMKGKRMVVPGWRHKIIAYLSRIDTTSISGKVVRFLQRQHK
mgnify:CR=1 FL=1